MSTELAHIACQKAAPFKGWAQINEREWIMEPKLDGFRLISHIRPHGRVTPYTRSLKQQGGKLPAIEAELAEIFPPDTIVDGEICSIRPDGRGNDFVHVQNVMLSGVDEAARKVAERPLQYLLFDVTRYNGFDCTHLPLEQRQALIANRIAKMGENRKHVDLIPQMPATEENHDALVAVGFEGSIVKKRGTAYARGKRVPTWQKIKDQPDVDVVVLGYTDAREGKFEGLVGAVEFGQPFNTAPIEIQQRIVDMGDAKAKKYLRTIDGRVYIKRGQCSGMDDAERAAMTVMRDNGQVGYVITVAHMGLMESGITMRHPQFKRFREDRRTEDVVWHDR